MNNTIKYEFQVDENSDLDKQLYGMIIGRDLLWNMGVNILFKERQIQWNDDKTPLKNIGLVHNKDMCSMLYSMYTDSPLFQETEEKQDRIMDYNYLNVVYRCHSIHYSAAAWAAGSVRPTYNGINRGSGMRRRREPKPGHSPLMISY